MNDFDYDIRQKKNIARSARYVKNGSKSRKCSLPSDGMSRREWNERNGEIVNYNMDSPMDWNTFDSMPKDLQGEYIFGLAEKYHASQRDIADMMGVGRSKCYIRIKELGVWPFGQRTGERASKEQKAAWSLFLGNWMGKVSAEEPVKEKPVIEKKECKVVEKKESERVKIDKGSLSFSGKTKDIADAILRILGEGKYIVNIDFVAE